MKFKTIIFSAALYIVAFIPNTAGAYEVLDTNAYHLNDTTSLFTITYEFGYLNGVAAMPILSTYLEPNDTNLPNLSYELTDADGEELPVNNVNTASVVLSDANVSDNYYFIESGDRQKFTLLVLHTTTDTQPTNMSVTSLGHQVKVNNEIKYLTVSDEQLQDYQVTIGSN